MPAISNLNIVLGRSFIPADDQYATRVVIVGYDIVDKLLPNVDPIGQEIRVDGEPYTVIGVGERQGETLGVSQDNYVAVPITAYQHTYGTNDSVVIYVKAGSVGPALDRASDEARVILRSRRHDPPGAEDSFELSTNETFVGPGRASAPPSCSSSSASPASRWSSAALSSSTPCWSRSPSAPARSESARPSARAIRTFCCSSSSRPAPCRCLAESSASSPALASPSWSRSSSASHRTLPCGRCWSQFSYPQASAFSLVFTRPARPRCSTPSSPCGPGSSKMPR